MTHTRDDVLISVQTVFRASDAAIVLSILDQYGTEHYERERERVQLAIIELSAGSEGKLRELVKAAKTDYRDILAWQQLGPLSEEAGKEQQAEARALKEKWGKK